MAYDPKEWFENPSQRDVTLRDKFAMAALSNMDLSNVPSFGLAAIHAYMVADKMLSARQEFQS